MKEISASVEILYLIEEENAEHSKRKLSEKTCVERQIGGENELKIIVHNALKELYMSSKENSCLSRCLYQLRTGFRIWNQNEKNQCCGN